MNAWRSIIVVISLGQIAAGVACLVSPSIPDAGVFGFTVCTVVGLLGLLTPSSEFLRPAAVAANATLAMLFLPAFISRIISWAGASGEPAGAASAAMADLIAAGMVLSGFGSARILWRLSARSAASSRPETRCRVAGGA